jgi:hypothetical protein
VKIYHLRVQICCHHRAQRKACLAVEKLWKGENKLQLIFRMVENQMREKSMNDTSNDAAAAAVQTHTDAGGCSDDDEPDMGEAVASTSKKTAQKQKSKKKSKKSKGRGKK